MTTNQTAQTGAIAPEYPVPSTSAAFSFTRIADQGASSPFTFSFFSGGAAPGINDSGTVVFYAGTQTPIPPQNFPGGGVFAGEGGGFISFLPDVARYTFGRSLDINNKGAVVFLGTSALVGVPVNFTDVSTLPRQLQPSIGETNPVINDNNLIATLNFLYPTGEKAIFLGPPDSRRIIARQFSGTPYFVDLGSPSLNNSGTVAFTATTFTPGSGNSNKILTTSGDGRFNTIVDDSGAFSSFGDAQINDRDNVAFVANLDAGGAGIFKSIGGSVTQVVSTQGSNFSRFNAVGLNNQGDVAFLADLSSGQEALFIASGTTVKPVIAVGDTLLGSTVTDLNFSPNGFNNSGQVAFFAALANGNRGIFRTDVYPASSRTGTDIQRSSGNNTISTGSGSDRITLNQGNNTVSAGDGDNGIAIGLTNVNFFALAPWANAISGLPRAGVLGNNRVTTGSGDDFIAINGSNNVITAGDGFNLVALYSGGNTVTTGNGRDLVAIGFKGYHYSSSDISTDAPVAGISGSTVNTGGGSDIVRMGLGDDTINVGEGNNTVVDVGGNNRIEAGSGNDSITTGDGNDRISAGEGLNTINAGNGANWVEAGSGSDRIITGTGDDSISAGEGENFIFAGDGNNRVETGSRNDFIATGAGDDLIRAGEGENNINAGEGNNRVETGSRTDYISTGAGNDTIFAGEGANSISTNAGNDIIYAGSGDDNIFAGAGNDLIYAGQGNNSINLSGAGDDIVYVGSGNDFFSLESGSGAATIFGYGVSDRIRLGFDLSPSDVSLTQLSGDTLITVTATNDLLAVLKSTLPSSVNFWSF